MSQLADAASIAGVLIAICGFLVTIWGVLRARSAAEQARDAAVKTREDIRLIDMVAEFSAAMAVMDEIKRLQRHGAWEALLDRYSALRKSLISIKTANPDLPREHRSALQGAVAQLTKIERLVERAVAAGQPPKDVPRLNLSVTKQIDSLQEVLVAIKTRIGG